LRFQFGLPITTHQFATTAQSRQMGCNSRGNGPRRLRTQVPQGLGATAPAAPSGGAALSRGEPPSAAFSPDRLA
jgi:hypothetical protein